MLLARELQIGPVDGHGGGFLADVEQADFPRTVVHRLGIYLCLSVPGHLCRLFAERVLVDLEHFIVGEQAEGKVIHLLQVAADQQRTGQQTPQADVRILLVRREMLYRCSR